MPTGVIVPVRSSATQTAPKPAVMPLALWPTSMLSITSAVLGSISVS